MNSNRRVLAVIVVLLAAALWLFVEQQRRDEAAPERPQRPERPAVPAAAEEVLRYTDQHDRAPEGYEGGRPFHNLGEPLPTVDDGGRRIRYREWDIHPRQPGRNRGPERLVTGSDGSAYYTADHYRTFTKIR